MIYCAAHVANIACKTILLLNHISLKNKLVHNQHMCRVIAEMAASRLTEADLPLHSVLSRGVFNSYTAAVTTPQFKDIQAFEGSWNAQAWCTGDDFLIYSIYKNVGDTNTQNNPNRWGPSFTTSYLLTCCAIAWTTSVFVLVLYFDLICKTLWL